MQPLHLQIDRDKSLTVTTNHIMATLLTFQHRHPQILNATPARLGTTTVSGGQLKKSHKKSSNERGTTT
jgi:hypothetical protein